MSNPHQFTVMTHPVALATKRWYRNEKGDVAVEAWGNGAWYSAQDFTATTPAELATILTALETQPRTLLIRGELLTGRDPKRVRRAIKASDDGPAGFREAPRRWLMLDCDQTLTPAEAAGLDPSTVEGAEAGVKALVRKLPSCFHGVSCVWQLSSSAGMKPGFKAHLFFFLDRAMGQRELKKWGRKVNEDSGRKLLDLSVFDTTHALYIARPVFEDFGVLDPCKVRIGLLEGDRAEVSMPIEGGPRATWREIVANLADLPDPAIHEHVRDAAFAYFCEGGVSADEASIFRILREAANRAYAIQGREPCPDENIRELVTTGKTAAGARAQVADRLILNTQGQPQVCLGNAQVLLEALPVGEQLWINVRSQQPMIGDQELADKDARELVASFRDSHKFACPETIAWSALVSVAEARPQDRFRSYLESVVWDGKPGIDTWLIEAFGVDDTPYARAISAMWLIQAAARTLRPGCQAESVLILEGIQGLRKTSSFIELFGEGLVGSDLPDIHSKDAQQYLHGPACIEIKEWDRFKGKDASHVKGFVDQRSDRYRAPYARPMLTQARRCVFVATTNEQEYLQDVTGARRFWPAYCHRRPVWGWFASRRDQLWAEAVARLDAGEAYWAEADDPRFVGEQEARREIDTLEADILAAVTSGIANPNSFAVKSAPIEPNSMTVTVKQIMDHVQQLTDVQQNSAAQKRISRALRALGWKQTFGRTNGKRTRIYLCAQ